MNALRPVKLWPSLMKSPTYFDSLPPHSPPLSTTAPFIPWSCWLSLCQRKERHCSTARIRKNFPSFHKPYLLKVSHPYCLWQASASRIQSNNNCTSPNLLDYIHRSAPNWPAPNYATVHKLRVLRETPFTVTGVNFARPPQVRSDNGETKSCNTFGSLLVQSEGHFIWMFFTSNREQFPIKPSAGSQAVNHCQ